MTFSDAVFLGALRVKLSEYLGYMGSYNLYNMALVVIKKLLDDKYTCSSK